MRTVLLATFEPIYRYRSLITWNLRGQDASELFKSVLGRLWHLIGPLTDMLIYYFLVVIVFKARGIAGGPSPFVYIMLGLVHYNILSRCGTATSTISQEEGILKQIPIDPIVFMATHFLRIVRDTAWSFVVFAAFLLIFRPTLGLSILAYPLILTALLVFGWTLIVLVGTGGVYMRDLARFSTMVMRILMYLSPVVYLSSFYPPVIREILFYTPFACLFGLLQWSVLSASLGDLAICPGWHHIAVLVLWIAVFFVVAHVFYARSRAKFTKLF